jgi:hypothetical protein
MAGMNVPRAFLALRIGVFGRAGGWDNELVSDIVSYFSFLCLGHSAAAFLKIDGEDGREAVFISILYITILWLPVSAEPPLFLGSTPCCRP